MSQLFQELKRRNVFRVAFAYLAVAWLVLQAADIVLDNIAAPDWLMQALMFFMVAGFPVAALFAWAFEMTPEGIKKEAEVDRSVSITQNTGKKLNRIIIGVLAAAVVFLLADKFVLVDEQTAIGSTEQSVAVLPFVAMSRGPDDEYFADGLTEEILNSLTRLPELLVTARTSSFHFKGQDLPVPEIAAKLGVAHIVEGSVRRDGDRLRVTAQLIRAEDGFHLWSENYDRDSQDTFGVQTDIAEKIASALDVVLDEKQRAQMLETGVRNPEAFVAFQKGIELFNQAHGSATMLESLQEANIWFDRAIQLEPEFPDPYIWSADYYTHYLMDFMDDEAVTVDERKAAMDSVISRHQKTIRYAADDETRATAAYDLAVITGEWRKLPALFDDFVAASECLGSGWMLETTVPYGKAAIALEIALAETECNPLDFSGWVSAASAQTTLGNTDAAIATALKGIEVTPHVRIYQMLFFAYLAADRFTEAEAIIDRHIHRDNQSLPLRMTLAAARGDVELAKTRLDDMLQLGDDLIRPPVVSFAVIGDREAANKEAARIDALPNGYLTLMLFPTICRCGAPWDLDVTPNFAKLIDEANFSWPPPSPVDWPLKDW